jgi:hypothetical protein
VLQEDDDMSAQDRKPRRKPEGHRERSANIPGYKTELQTAEELGLGVRTLRQYRHVGKGPAYAKFGRQILYRADAIASWLRGQEVQPIRELTA